MAEDKIDEEVQEETLKTLKWVQAGIILGGVGIIVLVCCGVWLAMAAETSITQFVGLEKDGAEINCKLTDCKWGNSTIVFNMNVYYVFNPKSVPDFSEIEPLQRVCKHVDCDISVRSVRP
jgi:hypothetical protein